jgi:hypothetical protein
MDDPYLASIDVKASARPGIEFVPGISYALPLSVVLADGGAPAVLADALASVVLADGGAPAVPAMAPHSAVLVDGGAPAVLASAPASVVLAD